MLKKKLSVDMLRLTGKRVLIRADFNVPIESGRITNNQRITESLDTIHYALKKKAKSVVLCSHLGRPKGRIDPKLTLSPVALELSNLLNRPVQFLPDCVGSEVESACANPTPGSVILLENLRFHIEEEGEGINKKGEKIAASFENMKTFRESMSKLGDVYVNDAFGTSHRAHSSMLGIGFAERASGFLLKKELMYFSKVIENPVQPFLAILGGSKVEDKILLIENLLDKVSDMIISGGMAYTFLKELHNMKIGASLFDPEGAKLVKDIMNKAKKNNVTINLPVDFVIAKSITEEATVGDAVLETGIPEGWMGVDIGIKSSALFNKIISEAKVILWNGPPGVFEFEKFSGGSRRLLAAVAEATERGAMTIVGGGDTATCVTKYSNKEKFSHVSTGGGAALELMQGSVLPGIAALTDI